MEAIAKHDFNATADDELSFRKNQILKVNVNNSYLTLNINRWLGASISFLHVIHNVYTIVRHEIRRS